MSTPTATPEYHAKQAAQTNEPAPASLLIDVNTASIDDLQLLPSIGPKLAQRIIDDRTEHGPYESLKELDRVTGIGPKTLERLADWVSFSMP